MSKKSNVPMPKLVAYTAGKEKLEILRKVRLTPALNIYLCSAGGTFVYVEISWASFLLDGTLRVLLDHQTDVTSQFVIDTAARKATATVDAGAVGTHLFEATGEFLAQLVPVRLIQLPASGYVYIPY